MNRSTQSLFISCALAIFLCATQAHATITSCDETTIRNAVAARSAIFGVNCSITLTKGPLQIPPDLIGFLLIPIQTTINGNGFAVTINGGNNQGVINIPSGSGLILQKVTIADGQTASSTGGGITNSGSLSVSGCTFTDNTNAILNNGSMSVASSTFTGNKAPQGGAIIQTSSIKAYISNSSFGTTAAASGNGGGAQGGAIYISGTSAEIDGSSFIGNVATEGGAIYAFASTLTLNNVYFQGNTTNPGGTGGAIANLGSDITITNPFASIFGFQSNQAVNSSTTLGQGGAIYNATVETVSCGTFCLPLVHTPSLTVNTVFFGGNSAGYGGAIFDVGNSLFGSSGGVTKAVNSYFQGNSAATNGISGLGGGIDNEGAAQLTVSGSTFKGNLTNDISSPIGSLGISNSTFAGSGTGFGAAIYTGRGLIQYSTIAGAYAAGVASSGNGIPILESTIIDISPNLHGCSGVADGGDNLENGNSCPFSLHADPQIDFSSLGFNGGPTPTFPLPTGSPAIDKIPEGTLSCGALGQPGGADQRGVSRPQGLLCDIGAIEHLFSNLPTSGTTCDGIYNKTFTGDIDVLPGQKCVFLSGGVTGNVTVHGGRFELRNASVGGDVEVFGDSSAAIGSAGAITGNLQIHDLASISAQSQVCGSNVHGSVEVHNNAAAVTIGAEDQTSCLGNTIGGTLDLHNNSAATSAAGNTVTGDLQDHNNSGPSQVFNNLIQGVLSCNQNTSITGALDSAKQKEGQCATF